MRLDYVLYMVCLFGGGVGLLAVAYAIPQRLKNKFPIEFAQLRNVPPTASTEDRRRIVLRTGDPALLFYLHVQRAGFYIWAIGMLTFSGFLLLWD